MNASMPWMKRREPMMDVTTISIVFLIVQVRRHMRIAPVAITAQNTFGSLIPTA